MIYHSLWIVLNLVNDKSFIKPNKKHDSQFANHEHVM